MRGERAMQWSDSPFIIISIFFKLHLLIQYILNTEFEIFILLTADNRRGVVLILTKLWIIIEYINTKMTGKFPIASQGTL
jgi:hypothetical protein